MDDADWRDLTAQLEANGNHDEIALVDVDPTVSREELWQRLRIVGRRTDERKLVMNLGKLIASIWWGFVRRRQDARRRKLFRRIDPAGRLTVNMNGLRVENPNFQNGGLHKGHGKMPDDVIAAIRADAEEWAKRAN